MTAVKKSDYFINIDFSPVRFYNQMLHRSSNIFIENKIRQKNTINSGYNR